MEVKLGFLSCGGIYTCPIMEVGEEAPVVQGLQVSNLSTECRCQPDLPGSLLVLRLWADRPGPFETSFTVRLPQLQREVGAAAEVTAEGRELSGIMHV